MTLPNSRKSILDKHNTVESHEGEEKGSAPELRRLAAPRQKRTSRSSSQSSSASTISTVPDQISEEEDEHKFIPQNEQELDIKAQQRATEKGINPGLRLRAIEAASKSSESLELPLSVRLQPNRTKIRHAFWDITGIISLFTNAFFIALLIITSREVFVLKRALVGNLLGGLYVNFNKMDDAHIKTDIELDGEVPFKASLPLTISSDVILTEDTLIKGALISLNTGGLNISNAPANIILPAGSRLPIQLDAVIPIDNNLIISIAVPIDIPISQTELHEPFTDLRDEIIGPYLTAFWSGPYYWEDLPACKPINWFCDWWFH